MATEVYEWVLTGYLANEFVQTVQHVKLDVVGTPNPYLTAQQVATGLIAGAGPIDALLECLPEDYTASSLRVARVSAGGGPTAIKLATEFGSSVGGRSGHISSAQANPLIIWIPATGANNVGKLFLPGVSEDDIQEMVLEVGLTSAMENFIGIMSGTITMGPEEGTGCIFHRATKTGTEFLTGYVSPLIGTQRRRLHPV